MSTEAQLRIEFKLDLIISALQAGGLMLPAEHLPQMLENSGDICPVCTDEIVIVPDVLNECYSRSCGCKPARRLVPGVSKLMKNQESKDSADKKGAPDGEEQAAGPG